MGVAASHFYARQSSGQAEYHRVALAGAGGVVVKNNAARARLKRLAALLLCGNQFLNIIC